MQCGRRAIQLGTEVGSPAHAAVGLVYARQADILREWNQLDVALDLVLQGLQLLILQDGQKRGAESWLAGI